MREHGDPPSRGAHARRTLTELRREAVGCKNWLFIGSDDAGEVNDNFVSLIASAQLQELEPGAYLRTSSVCSPPGRASECSISRHSTGRTPPKRLTVQAALLANPYRRAILG